jgi:hypothetical protein
MIPQLGRLSAVDLRDAWSSEAQHFTPWLAEAVFRPRLVATGAGRAGETA